MPANPASLLQYLSSLPRNRGNLVVMIALALMALSLSRTDLDSNYVVPYINIVHFEILNAFFYPLSF